MAEGIAYQNKDIEFKVLSEAYREKSFEAYGLKLPKIKAVLPTDLPAVSANEMRMDNLFLLEDGSYALVDYESKNETKNRIKYVNYIARVLKRLYGEKKEVPVIRMIVIYTGDVTAAEKVFQAGCIVLEMEQVFVRHFPAEEFYQKVKKKIREGRGLTEQELMQLIILPLAEKGRKRKQRRIRQVIKIAKKIKNEDEQKLVYSGLLVISDKFISKADAESIRKEITMTKVGRLIYEDGLLEGKKEGKKEGIKKGKKEERIIAVINLLDLEIPEQKILEKYSEKDLRAAKKALEKTEL